MKTSPSTLRRCRRPLAAIGAVAAALVLPLGMSAPAIAVDGPNLVVNGNFAEPVVPDGQPGLFPTEVPGWESSTGDFEVTNDTTWTPPAGSAPGTQSVDLNPNVASEIQQTVPTEPGMTYTLTFDLAGNLFNDPAVKTGDFYVEGARAGSLDFDTTGTSGTDMGWVTKSYTFTATDTATVISFASTTPNNFGPVITNVSLVATPDAGVPMANWQIGGVALLGILALLGIGAVVRRRSAAVA